MDDPNTLYASTTIAHDTLTAGSFRGALYPVGECRPGTARWVCHHKHRTDTSAQVCSDRELRRRALESVPPPSA